MSLSAVEIKDIRTKCEALMAKECPREGWQHPEGSRWPIQGEGGRPPQRPHTEISVRAPCVERC